MHPSQKIVPWDRVDKIADELRNKGKIIVFTNGCFDIIHKGHVEYLYFAKGLGDILWVGINSDESVKKIKGNDRPIKPLEDRLIIIASFEFVDLVTPFDQETPYQLIKKIKPLYIVKGGDYKADEVVGKEIVESYGGKVIIAPYIPGKSTTEFINKIKKL